MLHKYILPSIVFWVQNDLGKFLFIFQLFLICIQNRIDGSASNYIFCSIKENVLLIVVSVLPVCVNKTFERARSSWLKLWMGTLGLDLKLMKPIWPWPPPGDNVKVMLLSLVSASVAPGSKKICMFFGCCKIVEFIINCNKKRKPFVHQMLSNDGKINKMTILLISDST